MDPSSCEFTIWIMILKPHTTEMPSTSPQSPESTCSSSWTPSYAWNAFPQTSLEPFDSTQLDEQELSLVTQCRAAPYTFGEGQKQTSSVDCDLCPDGWSLTPVGLACREGANSCTSKCNQCQQSMLEWYVSDSCEMCIGKPVCGSDGKCSCDIF